MCRVKILDRYLFLEIVTPFFLSLGALTLVLFLQKMFRLAELIVSKGATVWSSVKLLLYILPSFLVLTIPMSFLVATLTAFTRLCSDSEVTAMKASRISLYEMMRPVMLFSVLVFLISASTSLFIAPGANRALKIHLFELVKSRALIGIEPGVFSSTFDGMVIFVDSMKSLDEMQGVFISDEHSAREPYAIVARSGKLITDPDSLSMTLSMKLGEIHANPRDEQSYSTMTFDSGSLYLDISQALIQKGPSDRSFNEMGSLELYHELKRARAEDKPAIKVESELHKRVSIPFACLLFGLIGAPLGIRRTRSGKSAGIGIALLVFLVYYMVLAAGTNLSDTGKLHPAVAYWMPNAVMTGWAVFLVIKKSREIDFQIITSIKKVVGRLGFKKIAR